MYSTASKVHKLHYYTRLGNKFRSDLSWWNVFLENWNGLGFMRYIKATPKYHYNIQTDASRSWGCGAVFQGRLLQWKWPAQWMPMNIMAKEMVQVVLSCSV